ncbi:unnamed protein product [Adineta steineri]|uniref:Uncharacterized protein n=1 Tax=Adineta steineri TaxID=433720 RepID=A0A815VHA1_9BILA|nr:unnamed protein product [Adineta steineri]CAF1531988.1 unnamed protein product [Adineta steineri]CAF4110850.1 unnamed protein product [Adineta steineri]
MDKISAQNSTVWIFAQYRENSQKFTPVCSTACCAAAVGAAGCILCSDPNGVTAYCYRRAASTTSYYDLFNYSYGTGSAACTSYSGSGGSASIYRSSYCGAPG